MKERGGRNNERVSRGKKLLLSEHTVACLEVVATLGCPSWPGFVVERCLVIVGQPA